MGDKNKIVHNLLSLDMTRLFDDSDRGRLSKNLSSFYTRPAYSGTKASVGGLRDCICKKCPYYGTAESGLKKKCLFPWFDPKDHDVAVYEYLPCAKGGGID